MRVQSKALLVLGIFLVGSAALVSNAALERFLTGAADGRLAWGPALFRALLALHGMLLAGFACFARSTHPAGTGDGGWGMAPGARMPWGWLSALTVVAVALRLWHLNSCLWLDEVFTLTDFARPSWRVIVSSFPNQNQHMLYSLMAHASLQAFGEAAWSLRLPSVLFGAGSIWALYLLGRRILGHRETLAACALMTVSYHHVWFSQNARGYMGLLFFAILATWLWIEAGTRNQWRWWVAYAAACALGIWIHMTMVFVIAAHGLVYLPDLVRGIRERRAAVWMPVGAWVLAGTFALQLLALALPEFLRTAVHEASANSEWTQPFWVIAESLRSLRMAYAGAAVLLGGLALVAAGWLDMARKDWRMAAIMVLPGLLGGGSMLALSHNLWPRFFFFCMGFALLVVIHGAVVLPRLLLRPLGPAMERMAPAAAIAAVSVMILGSAATLPRCYALPKQDFTGARDYAEQHSGAGGTVVAIGTAGQVYSTYFAPHWRFVETAAELDRIRRESTGMALVYTLPIELRAFHPEIWKMVEDEFETVKVFPGSLGGGEVYVSREKPVAAVRPNELKEGRSIMKEAVSVVIPAFNEEHGVGARSERDTSSVRTGEHSGGDYRRGRRLVRQHRLRCHCGGRARFAAPQQPRIWRGAQDGNRGGPLRDHRDHGCRRDVPFGDDPGAAQPSWRMPTWWWARGRGRTCTFRWCAGRPSGR